MNKLLLALFLLTTINYTAFSQSLGDLSFGTDETLEVITWNIENFPKNGGTTKDSVRKIIEALDVDIIALQEISDTNVFRRLVDSLEGYEAFIGTNEYISLVYLYKTESVQVNDYYEIFKGQQYSNIFPRVPKVLEFTFQNQDFVVINNHFKCCGDGELDEGNTADEENRRYEASNLLKAYIDNNMADENVIVVGDLNDVLTDNESDNVFQNIIDDSDNYLFADMDIAENGIFNWSYPTWPSHLDHIMITNELFDDLERDASSIETILVDDYYGTGFYYYDLNISDHRPVGIKLALEGSVGVEEALAKANFTIAPNPSFDKAIIQSDYAIEEIRVYNSLGMECTHLMNIDSGSSTIAQLDLTNLAAGLYFVKVKNVDSEVLGGYVSLLRLE